MGLKAWFTALSVGKKALALTGAGLFGLFTVAVATAPAVTHETEMRPKTIPVAAETQYDESVKCGKEVGVTQEGSEGELEEEWEITLHDGEFHSEEKVGETITKEMQPKVITIGGKDVKETEKKSIPFDKTTRKDSSLLPSESYTAQNGQKGVRTITYVQECNEGQLGDKEEASRKVTKKPVNEMYVKGTKQVTTTPEPTPTPQPPSNDCDPNYTGCVPIASDVDCASGSGNGPEYLSETVEVIGSDIYGLDGDNDGLACEPY